MRATVFIWIGLLLIGSVSISKCYRTSNDDDDETPLDSYTLRSDALDELSELLQSSRSAKWSDLLDTASERKRDKNFQKRACTGCTPACKADQLCVAPNQCICPDGRSISPCPIQASHSCTAADTAGTKPVISITFGSGAEQYSKATPASLGFQTKYPQISNQKLTDGSFTIANAIPADYVQWLGGGSDHTQNCAGANKGYMMVVGVKITPDELFTTKADNLCIGLRYQFSISLANIVKAGTNYIKPNIKIEVLTTPGNILLATKSTGDIAEQNKLTWVYYGLSFVTPSKSVVVRVSSIVPGGTGNDVAIDDISLVSCSPGNNGVCQ